MSHYAEIGEDNIVKRVIVVNDSDQMKNGVEDDETGSEFCNKLLGGIWKKTSYNSRIRKNYAGIGYTYDKARDAFIPPKPYDSWALNEETCMWNSPVPMPTDNKMFAWDEEKLNWVEIGGMG